MLLRNRISLVVATGFAAITLLMTGAGALRESLLQQRLSDTALAGQSALWDETTDVEKNQLRVGLGAITAHAAFAESVGAENREAALKAMADAFSTAFSQAGAATAAGAGTGGAYAGAPTLVAVVGAGRDTLFSVGATPGAALLDASSFDRVLAGAEVSGLRQSGVDQPYLLAARAITLRSGPAVLVVGRSAQPALERMAKRLAGSATLISLRGQLTATTDAGLWQRAALAIPPRTASFRQLEMEQRVYTVSSVPVRDVSGGSGGALVLIGDVTEAQGASRTLDRLSIGAALLLAVLGVLGLNAYLSRSFRPLQSAIDALAALSRGDVSVRLDAHGSDEIGRIGEAVRAFRQDAHHLATSRALRERVRRRQEIVMRQALTALAEATESSGRDELLALLHTDAGTERADDALRQLAQVMGSLTARIIDQHQRLSAMVLELREALRVKTQLIAIQHELEIARKMQSAILPHEFKSRDGLSMHATMTPAKEIGGDFYDFFALDDHRIAMIVADVSGKGVPAALFMAVSRTLLRAVAKFGGSPADCLFRLNDLLASDNDQMMFVTLFYAVIDTRDGSIVYANAGHNPPYILRGGSGDIEAVPATRGVALAVMEGMDFEEASLVLAPGDRIFMYTDGVTEAFNTEQQMFGDERLRALLRQIRDLPVDAFPQSVEDAVHAFEAGGAQTDDITCLVARYDGPTPVLAPTPAPAA